MRFILSMQIEKFHADANYFYETSKTSYKQSTVLI